MNAIESHILSGEIEVLRDVSFLRSSKKEKSSFQKIQKYFRNEIKLVYKQLYCEKCDISNYKIQFLATIFLTK